jgi:hypothetical protein
VKLQRQGARAFALLAGAFGLLLPTILHVELAAGEGRHQILSEQRQAQILKEVVVSYIGLLADDPALRSNLAYMQMDAKISALLFLFDSLSDPAALKVFASLNSYYIGEHSNEIYECLARRKGRALESYLQELVHQRSTECEERFRSRSRFDRVAICLTRNESVQHAETLIEEIRSGSSCSNDELLQ